MTASSSRELFQQAPRTGPWIIAYVVSIAAVSLAANAGIVDGPGPAAPFWVAILGSTGMIIYTSWKRHRILGSLSDAVRSFWRRIVISAGFMFASYCLLAYAQMVGQWSEGLVEAIAFLPIVGFVGMIWCIHQYVLDESDGYLRAQSIRQLLIASFVTLVVGTACSALAQAELIGSVDIGLIILIWFGGLGIGRLVNEIRP